MRTTKSVTISLPPEQFKIAERLAKRQSRTISELFREGLRRLQQEEEERSSPIAHRDLRAIIQLIQQEARRTGLNKMSMREIDAEVAAARKEMVAKVRPSKTRARK